MSRTRTAARERTALWAALALIVVWGANFSVQKAVFAALSPGGFLFVRYLIMPVARGAAAVRALRPALAAAAAQRAAARCSGSASPATCCTSGW